jgi:hypothetical protein
VGEGGDPQLFRAVTGSPSLRRSPPLESRQLL